METATTPHDGRAVHLRTKSRGLGGSVGLVKADREGPQLSGGKAGYVCPIRSLMGVSCSSGARGTSFEGLLGRLGGWVAPADARVIRGGRGGRPAPMPLHFCIKRGAVPANLAPFQRPCPDRKAADWGE